MFDSLPKRSRNDKSLKITLIGDENRLFTTMRSEKSMWKTPK